MKSGSEMLNCPEFGSLITASGFIEHIKAVARGEAEKTIPPAEMSLSMAVIYKMGIFSKIS